MRANLGMCVRREQALELLRRGWAGGGEARYDTDAAAVLCRTRRFTPGLLFLYERMRLFREVLQVWHWRERHHVTFEL